MKLVACVTSAFSLIWISGCTNSSSKPTAANNEAADNSPRAAASEILETPEITKSDPSPSEGSELSQAAAEMSQDATELSTSDSSTPVNIEAQLSASELQQTAIEALDTGDTGEAFRLIRLAQAAGPDDPQTTFVKARILAERNRFREAVRLLDELAMKDPQAQLPVMGQTAEWLVHQGDWKEAESRYRTLLQILGDDAPALVHRMLGRLLLREGRRSEATIHLNKLCRVGDIDQFELLSLLNRFYPIEDAGSGEEESEPIGSLGRARIELANDRLQEALSAMTSENDTLASEESHALLGRIYAEQGDIESLKKWAVNSTSVENRFADEWFGIAKLRMSERDYTAAQNAIVQSIKGDPANANAYELLSQIRAELGDANGSKLAAERSKTIEQTYEVGKTLSQTPDDDRALTTLIQLLEELQRPFEAIAWQGLHTVYQREGVDAAQLQTKLQQLNQRRQELLRSGNGDPNEEFVLCLEDSPQADQ